MTTIVQNILNEARKYIGVTQGSSTHKSIVNVYLYHVVAESHMMIHSVIYLSAF